LGDQLCDQLLLDAKLLRLCGRERTAQLTADLLETVVVGLPELLDGNLGVADLGEGRTAVAAENVADAPDAERQNKEAHHSGHDAFAEPGGGGFAHTSEHGGTNRRWRKRGRSLTARPRIIGTGPTCGNSTPCGLSRTRRGWERRHPVARMSAQARNPGPAPHGASLRGATPSTRHLHGADPPPAARGQLEDDRAQSLGGRGR